VAGLIRQINPNWLIVVEDELVKEEPFRNPILECLRTFPIHSNSSEIALVMREDYSNYQFSLIKILLC
jgi:hypothetical protein